MATAKQLKTMTESQLTRALLAGKITKAQHDARMREIATKRHAEELRKDPMKRYYATGVLPGAKKRKARRKKA